MPDRAAMATRFSLVGPLPVRVRSWYVTFCPPPIGAGPIGRARECPRGARRRGRHQRRPSGCCGTAQAQTNEPAEVISRQPGGGGPLYGFQHRRLDLGRRPLRGLQRPACRTDAGSASTSSRSGTASATRRRRPGPASPPSIPEQQCHDQRRRLCGRLLGKCQGGDGADVVAARSLQQRHDDHGVQLQPDVPGAGRCRPTVRSSPGRTGSTSTCSGVLATTYPWLQRSCRRRASGRLRCRWQRSRSPTTATSSPSHTGRAPAPTTRHRPTCRAWDRRNPNVAPQVISRTAAGGASSRELVRPVDLRRRQPGRVLLVRHRSGGRATAGEPILRRRVRPADLHDAPHCQRRQRARHQPRRTPHRLQPRRRRDR